MLSFRRPAAIRSSSPALASLGVALAVAFVPAGALTAQLQPQASYPLLTDLLDATNNYSPVVLRGTPPPSAPANGVCHNGVYYYSTGQDIATPLITTLNTNDFQVDVEFVLAAMPPGNRPVLMGGSGWRWIGIYVQANGIVGLKYNNSNFTWSSTTLAPGIWYLASIRFENGVVELHLNGRMIHQFQTGALNTSTNLNFTTNDFSNGAAFNGCIRNLVISNDTTLGRVASSTNYGNGCDGLTLAGNGVPSLGNALFGLDFTNVPAISPIAFVGLGFGIVDPGLDLTPLGMAGCFAFHNLSAGLFGPAVVIGGSGTYPLPIPNLPTLTGMVLFSQGLSQSSATTAGLATSNGVQLVIGL